MTIRKIGIVVLIFILSIVALIYAVRTSNTVAARLFVWGIDMQLDMFSFARFDKSDARFSKSERLEADRGTTKLFISKTTIEDYEKFIHDKKFVLESLFVPNTSPYPEVITNIVECSDEFKPKIQNVVNGTIYTLFAGERYNYGVCTEDLITYSSEYGIFDCKEKGIFEVRLFSEDEKEPRNIMKSFNC